jgi:alpha-galactosidase
MDVMRRPDSVTARFGSRQAMPLQFASGEWTCAGVRVTTEPAQDGLPVRVTASGGELTYLQLRWQGKQSQSLLTLGDHWERSYGDLEWRGTIPQRAMPWYFVSFDGKVLNGYGVKTQPAAFCFWQSDTDGISLTLDLRNGGEPALLGQREILACTVVTRLGARGETPAEVAREFCKRMCTQPRLPAEPLFGSNDWNYAYGRNTAAGILRDADLIASLAPAGAVRPHIVIDDGYQDPVRFPSMADLAKQIRARQLHPGIWIRPLRAAQGTPQNMLLPAARLGPHPDGQSLAFDPTIPEAFEMVLQTVQTPVDWGYRFIKHDFSTVELFGRWGFEMDTGPSRQGWHFSDRSRTNAEIVADLYGAIRKTAGEQTIILGCNTVGHIAAGIFESQRVADDTSGRDWERTRRFGVNGLSQRIAQHRTFSYIDPDCVAVTRDVDWRQTSQWMDVVARSGTSLFLSPEPGAITPEVRSAMKDALATAAQSAVGHPTDPWQSTAPDQWQFEAPHRTTKVYDWSGVGGASAFPS